MSDSSVRKLIFSLCSLWISLLLVDFFLRFATSKYKTYLEKSGLPYRSPYHVQVLGWFHIMKPNNTLSYKKAEFTYFRKTNSLGLADREFNMEKDTNEFRIIALGDSFTEGNGTTYETTWVKSLERTLSEKYPNRLITAYNCGVSGSDPIFDYMLFKEKLLKYRPDLVVVTLNFSDVDDIIIRGGIERFKSNGKVKYNKPPKWEKFYATSFVFRVLIHDLLHYNWILVDEDDYNEKRHYALGEIDKIIDKFKQLSTENNFKLLIVLNPLQLEVEKGTYFLEQFSEILKDNEVETLDLLQIYLNNNIITQENAHQFYWRLDLHHNTEGYRIMGQNIAEKIIEENYIN